MAFVVRDASSGDLPALQSLFRRASLSNIGDRAVLLEHPAALEFDASSLTEARVRVLVEGGVQVVGFATTRAIEDSLELVDLFTDPQWMRRGVATRLIADIVSYARASGFLFITVTGNPHALQFYERVGFINEGEASTEFGPGHRMRLVVTV
jgi:GNAT superfamily N-acetyltransferase